MKPLPGAALAVLATLVCCHVLAQAPATAGKQDGAKARPAAKVRYANLTLRGAIEEGEAGGLLSGTTPSLAKTIARIETAAQDSGITGMVLDIQSPTLGRGAVNEVRAAIKRFRAAGKPIIAQLDSATAGDYLIATACDQIVMPESGMLTLPGVRAEELFMKGLLAKAGVEADFIHMGEAKGYGETYTRDGWSEPVKQNLTAMVDDLYVQLYETIGLERPLTEQQARDAVDRGVLSAREALRLGLIDRLAYPDEVRETLAERHAGSELVYLENYGGEKIDTDFSGPAGLFKLMGVLAGAGGESAARGKKIAVVYAVGPIETGKSTTDLLGSASVGSTTLVRALDEANRDKDVAAIVLRVNSPGGSAIASDLIWRKTQQLDKPLVASMGDVAASGGYYISMGADKVYAEPQTVTGSIGVVSGKLALAGLYEKLGLSIDTISRGENSGIFSDSEKFTDKQREAMLRMMQDVYDQFTSKAAEGRGMPREGLLKLASGRVYTGRQAQQNGLVDELGSLHDAIAAAKQMAGIAADERVRVITLPEPPDLIEELLGGGEEQREVSVRVEGLVLPPGLVRAAARMSFWQRLLEREHAALLLPFDVRFD